MGRRPREPSCRGPGRRPCTCLASARPRASRSSSRSIRSPPASRTRSRPTSSTGIPNAGTISRQASSITPRNGAFGAIPDLHDGFLRIAPRTFAEAQGSPRAALELEDLRTHAAFMKSVPPERRPLVLVDTVIGMLALDPGNGFAKLGVASLLRQTVELPGAVLARAGLAMLRAGDRESAAIAL